ncbi:RNase A-like domain-containing protein [Acetobacter fabarum]|uniref:RNase A-like domain-containing protein n=1 Tax=Acetobacter fabarum TaxID=483199 RepID=UPI00319E8B99
MLSNHVALTDERIAYRFDVEKRPAVSCFVLEEGAEHAIYEVLQENADKIDDWLKTARMGAKLEVGRYVSAEGAFVISASDRARKRARYIQATIVKEECRGMVYYIHTVRFY